MSAYSSEERGVKAFVDASAKNPSLFEVLPNRYISYLYT